MMESAGQEKWNWKLRTSTETIDYFWIDDHMRTTRKSIFFGCVDDESSQRSGYFLLEEKYVEIGVNNLDAQRKDRFGRNISNSLLLRSSRKDEQRTEWLRKMFVEAICDASKDPVVAILAREFYNLWKSRDASHSSGDTWSVPSKTPVIPVDSPSPDSVLPGWQYARTPESWRRFSFQGSAFGSARSSHAGSAASGASAWRRPPPALICW